MNLLENSMIFKTITPEDTQILAASFAHVSYQLMVQETLHEPKGIFIALEGDLGAGKTCFSQGFIRALVPNAQVKSPTYTLVESYPLIDERVVLYHLDLYRIYDAEELEYLGIRDFFWHNICLIEWASRAEGWLPEPDIRIQLQPCEAYHQVLGVATSELGRMLLALVSQHQPR